MIDGFDGRDGEPSHLRQRPALGARRLALRAVRGLFPGRNRCPRARPPPREFRSAADSGGIIPSASGSRFSCHGTTNPWGHEWNALGEAFFINTVNGHLWHMIPGTSSPPAHDRARTPVYTVIDQHADHYHWDNSKDYKKFAVPGSLDDHRGAVMPTSA